MWLAPATPRAGLLSTQAHEPGSHGMLPQAVAEGRKDGQGRDDDEDNEADGASITESNTFESDFATGGGGGSNIVRLRNRQDGRLRIRGNVDLNRIHGPRVMPRNVASAVASWSVS